MSIYNPYQSTRIFAVTPAPSGQNTSREVWEGYLNQQIDEINIVDERTNLLIGTIGGSVIYKFNELPKSYAAFTASNPDILGDVIEYSGGGLPQQQFNYIRLSNGNLAYINRQSNFMTDEILIYDAYDIETGDANRGYWVAYKINELNPNLLEKIADVKQTDDYFFNGFELKYVNSNSSNECLFIRHGFPTADSNLIFSNISKLTITKSGTTYSLSASYITYDFGGQTTIALYNSNAITPAAPGTANWFYRSPYRSLQNGYDNIMNGVDEGWVWYSNGISTNILFEYMAGFNVLTGQVAFINPIADLALTTNFNPAGIVDGSYFSFFNWESHPAGIFFGVYNKQPLNFYNNTNSVTGLFSPRWENKDLVTFLNQRDIQTGYFTSTGGNILNNYNFNSAGPSFDSEYIYLSGNITNYDGFSIVVSKFKLDSIEKKEEIKMFPVSTNGTVASNYFRVDIDNGFLGYYLDQAFIDAFPNNQFSWYNFIYWVNTSEEANRIQCNNTYPKIIIGAKFYDTFDTTLFNNTLKLGVQYDYFSRLSNTLNS